MNRSLIALVTGLLLLLTPPAARAAVITLLPVSMRTACDGCAGPLDGVFEVFTGLPSIAPALFLSSEQPSEERGALEFDLAGFNPANIASARLLLTVQGIITGPAPMIELNGFLGDGLVSLADMQVSHPLHTTEPLMTPDLLAPIDVTAFGQSTLADGNPFVGFLFRDIVINSGMFFNFTNDLPELQITTLPEPGSIFLFASGVIGFLLVRKRFANYHAYDHEQPG